MEKVDVILFIFDIIDENFNSKLKSYHDSINEINKEIATMGIINFKNAIKNQEKIKSILDVSKSLNIFYYEEKNNIDIDFFSNIKNKYLYSFENKVLEDENGTYIGDFKNGKKEGYGIMLYKNGGFFYGEWKNDLREGYGTLNEFMDIYDGEWEKDIFISGEKKGLSSRHYKGNFFNNEIYEGDYSYSDFLEYEGTFKGEYLYGKVEIKNGNIYKGMWENKFYKANEIYFNGNGEGTIIYKNGDIYEGKWKNFKKSGKGIIFKEDVTIFQSEWENYNSWKWNNNIRKWRYFYSRDEFG